MKSSLRSRPKSKKLAPSVKKGRFSGKKRAKLGQIDLARVGLDLGEVRVDRQDSVELGGHVVAHINARLPLGERVGKRVADLISAERVG